MFFYDTARQQMITFASLPPARQAEILAQLAGQQDGEPGEDDDT